MKDNDKKNIYYYVPKEVSKMFEQYIAMLKLRDIYVKQFFGYKKAKRAAIEAEHLLQLFWRKIRDIYPELKDKQISYDSENRKIKIV